MGNKSKEKSQLLQVSLLVPPNAKISCAARLRYGAKKSIISNLSELELVGFWEGKRSALVTLHVASEGAGPCLQLSSGTISSDSRSTEAFSAVYEQCLSEGKVACFRTKGDVDLLGAAVAITGADGTLQPGFWCYSTSLEAATVVSRLMDSCRLALVFDIDETLLVACSMSGIQSRLDAVQKAKQKLLNRADSDKYDDERLKKDLAKLEHEESLIEADQQLLKQFAKQNHVIVQGRIYLPSLEVAKTYEGTTVVRPVIRLPQLGLVLTRIDPNRLETSMMMRVRPGWEALKTYITADSADIRKHRFEIYLCTTAEKQYAMEAWRLLDPTQTLFPLDYAQRRIMCVHPADKKNIEKIILPREAERKLVMEVRDGEPSEPSGPVPLTVVVDDRTDVWETCWLPQIIKVLPYQHYKEGAAAAVSDGKDILPSTYELQRVQKVLANLRGSIYYEINEVVMKAAADHQSKGVVEEAISQKNGMTLPSPRTVSMVLQDSDSITTRPSLPSDAGQDAQDTSGRGPKGKDGKPTAMGSECPGASKDGGGLQLDPSLIAALIAALQEKSESGDKNPLNALVGAISAAANKDTASSAAPAKQEPTTAPTLPPKPAAAPGGTKPSAAAASPASEPPVEQTRKSVKTASTTAPLPPTASPPETTPAPVPVPVPVPVKSEPVGPSPQLSSVAPAGPSQPTAFSKPPTLTPSIAPANPISVPQRDKPSIQPTTSTLTPATSATDALANVGSLMTSLKQEPSAAKQPSLATVSSAKLETVTSIPNPQITTGPAAAPRPGTVNTRREDPRLAAMSSTPQSNAGTDATGAAAPSEVPPPPSQPAITSFPLLEALRLNPNLVSGITGQPPGATPPTTNPLALLDNLADLVNTVAPKSAADKPPTTAPFTSTPGAPSTLLDATGALGSLGSLLGLLGGGVPQTEEAQKSKQDAPPPPPPPSKPQSSQPPATVFNNGNQNFSGLNSLPGLGSSTPAAGKGMTNSSTPAGPPPRPFNPMMNKNMGMSMPLPPPGMSGMNSNMGAGMNPMVFPGMNMPMFGPGGGLMPMPPPRMPPMSMDHDFMDPDGDPHWNGDPQMGHNMGGQWQRGGGADSFRGPGGSRANVGFPSTEELQRLANSLNRNALQMGGSGAGDRLEDGDNIRKRRRINGDGDNMGGSGAMPGPDGLGRGSRPAGAIGAMLDQLGFQPPPPPPPRGGGRDRESRETGTSRAGYRGNNVMQGERRGEGRPPYGHGDWNDGPDSMNGNKQMDRMPPDMGGGPGGPGMQWAGHPGDPGNGRPGGGQDMKSIPPSSMNSKGPAGDGGCEKPRRKRS